MLRKIISVIFLAFLIFTPAIVNAECDASKRPTNPDDPFSTPLFLASCGAGAVCSPFEECEILCSNDESCPRGKYCAEPLWLELYNYYPINTKTCQTCMCSAAGTSFTDNEACNEFCAAEGGEVQEDCQNNDNNCSSGEICIYQPFLERYECKEGCRSDSDCLEEDKPHCNLKTNSCVSAVVQEAFETQFPQSSYNDNLSDDACLAETEKYRTAISTFIVHNILWGAGFMALDMTTSFLETLTIFGFQVGGIFEPIEDAVGFIRNIWMKAVMWGVAASLANWAAGALISAGLELNLSLTTSNTLVSYGGKIILQFANLGFVISLLFIGIATILRLQKDQFSANKLLIKLLVGAALVNLTIPIAGSLANLGTNITKSIYESAAPCPGKITLRFIAPYLYQDFKNALQAGEGIDSGGGAISYEGVSTIDPSDEDLSNKERKKLEEQAEKIKDKSSGFTKLVGGLALDYLALIAGSILSIVAALTFLAFALFLILRYVILMLLMVFAPLIWFGFIFKDLKLGKGNVWSTWWQQFLKWTFFGPIIILFLAFISEYLSSISSNSANTIISAATSTSGTPEGIFIVLAQLIAVIVISGIGLYLAINFSGISGKLIAAGVTGGIGFIAGKTQGILRRGQISAKMRADQLKAQGKTAKGLDLSAKLLKGAGKSFEIGDSAKNILSQMGVKPQISVPTEKEIREKIIKRRVGETESIGKKAGYALKEKLGFDSTQIDKNPSLVLGLKEDDVKDLSKEGKDSIVSAILKTQKEYAENNASLQPKQVIALRKLEKALGSELAQETIKKIPTLEEIKKETNPEEANKLKAELRNMLLMANESISDVLKNGTDEMIEKSVETIQALENEYKNNPNSFKQAEVAKLQKIRRDFDKKISDYVVGRLDPLTNPESILDLSNANLTNIAKTGTTIDKKKIDEALLKLVEEEEKLSSPEKNEAWNRLDAKVNVLKKKGDWV